MVVLEICVASLEAADTADGPTAPSCTPGQSCPSSFSRPVALRPFRENHLRQGDDDRSGMATMERMGLIETTQVEAVLLAKKSVLSRNGRTAES
jgi:hypothetical protein